MRSARDHRARRMGGLRAHGRRAHDRGGAGSQGGMIGDMIIRRRRVKHRRDLSPDPLVCLCRSALIRARERGRESGETSRKCAGYITAAIGGHPLQLRRYGSSYTYAPSRLCQPQVICPQDDVKLAQDRDNAQIGGYPQHADRPASDARALHLLR